MLDRASTFADPQIVKLLQTRYIPVAIDQAYQRRQKDAEGEFYRKIAGQGPRNNFEGTTQGFYVATPSGKLLLFNNNRDPAKVARLMTEKLAEFEKSPEAKAAPMITTLKPGPVDRRWNPELPEGGLIVRVRAKILDGYEPTDDPWKAIFQSALARDNLWLTKAEHQALVRGEILPSLQQRLARYHLVDNTRGEPPMWAPKEVRSVKFTLNEGQLQGRVELKTDDGKRGYEANLLGRIDVKDGKVVRFDVVALGDAWGEGPFTRGAPKGKFPLAVAFELADGSDVADAIPPQGSRGWIDGYLR